MLLTNAHVDSPIIYTLTKEIFDTSLNDLVSSRRHLITLHYDKITFGKRLSHIESQIPRVKLLLYPLSHEWGPLDAHNILHGNINLIFNS